MGNELSSTSPSFGHPKRHCQTASQCDGEDEEPQQEDFNEELERLRQKLRQIEDEYERRPEAKSSQQLHQIEKGGRLIEEMEKKHQGLKRKIEEMEKENQDLKCKIEEKKRTIEENNRLIEEHNRLIEKKNLLVEKKNRLIEKKKDLLIENELLDNNGAMTETPPEMETNLAAKSWPQQGQPAENEDGSKIKVQSHTRARVTMSENLVTDDDLYSFQLNLREKVPNKHGGFIMKLKTNLPTPQSNGTLEHFSGESVKSHLGRLVEDAADSLNLSGATAGKEFTIFSTQPELLVVRYKSRIILVIETLEPEVGHEVFHSEGIGGKCLDHCFALKKTGFSIPIVLVSTYNHLAFVCDQNDQTALRKLVERALGELKNNTGVIDRTSCLQTPQQEEKKNPKTPSLDRSQPECKLEVMGNDVESEEKLSNSNQEIEKQYGDRHVVYSKCFYIGENAFRALVLALKCAVLSAEDSVTVPNFPVQGTVVNNIALPAFSENWFGWKRVNHLTISFTNVPRYNHQAKYFYLYCELGTASTGTVYLALTSCGTAFAAKLHAYICKVPKNYSAEDMENAQRSELELLKLSAERERDRWIQLFSWAEPSCTVLKLDGKYFVSMPYCAPVPCEERQKETLEGTLKEISKVLKRFAQQGFSYGESNIQWRHVGRCELKDGDKTRVEYVFTDLALLEETEETKNNVDEMVENQIKILRTTAPNQDVVRTMPLFG